eukprot:767804-Hanusia_phi.AAC.11
MESRMYKLRSFFVLSRLHPYLVSQSQQSRRRMSLIAKENEKDKAIVGSSSTTTTNLNSILGMPNDIKLATQKLKGIQVIFVSILKDFASSTTQIECNVPIEKINARVEKYEMTLVWYQLTWSRSSSCLAMAVKEQQETSESLVYSPNTACRVTRL